MKNDEKLSFQEWALERETKPFALVQVKVKQIKHNKRTIQLHDGNPEIKVECY